MCSYLFIPAPRSQLNLTRSFSPLMCWYMYFLVVFKHFSQRIQRIAQRNFNYLLNPLAFPLFNLAYSPMENHPKTYYRSKKCLTKNVCKEIFPIYGGNDCGVFVGETSNLGLIARASLSSASASDHQIYHVLEKISHSSYIKIKF